MTMVFRTVKAAIETLLNNNAAGKFVVIGYEPKPKAASEFAGNNRTVRVFYTEGDFPKSAASLSTPVKHNVSMLLEMVVTAKSSVDLGVLDDPNSSDAQRAAALVGKSPAAKLADDQFDEFLDLVWNILMDPRNTWLGYTKYVVGDRWVPNFKKDKIIPHGNYAILTGYLRLDFNVEEVAQGATPSAFVVNETDFTPVEGDDVQQTIQETT